MSHSHDQMLVAIARGFAVVVDIEKIRPELEIDMIAKRFFALDELAQIRTLECAAKYLGFFNAWTRKEAYLKARSEGVGHGLAHFAVALVPGKPARPLSDLRDPGAVGCWCIHELHAATGYVAAVSAKALDCSVKEFGWSTAVSRTDVSQTVRLQAATLKVA